MDEIVIVDEQGNEHVFPGGFDPKRAAAIVRDHGSGARGEASTTSGTVAGLGAGAVAGMAARLAPAALRGAAAVPGILAPATTAAVVANDMYKGDYSRAAEHGLMGAGASGLAGKVMPRVASALGRVGGSPLFPSTAARAAGALGRHAGPIGMAAGVMTNLAASGPPAGPGQSDRADMQPGITDTSKVVREVLAELNRKGYRTDE